MDGEIDLTTADRDVLIAIIVRQQAIIESLEKRIAQLEGRAKSGGSRGMPGLKPKADGKPAQPKQPRKASTPRLCQDPHATHPAGGARGGPVSRLRNPTVRWVGPTALGKSSTCPRFRWR